MKIILLAFFLCLFGCKQQTNYSMKYVGTYKCSYHKIYKRYASDPAARRIDTLDVKDTIVTITKIPGEDACYFLDWKVKFNSNNDIDFSCVNDFCYRAEVEEQEPFILEGDSLFFSLICSAGHAGNARYTLKGKRITP